MSLQTGRAIAQTVSWPVCYREGMASIPGQSVCDLWWTEWHWDRFVSEYFGFPLSVLLQQCFILNFIWQKDKQAKPWSFLKQTNAAVGTGGHWKGKYSHFVISV
jgi:hypothetical protein